MISLDVYLNAVEQNRARVNMYAHGGDGSNGKCDCIGLIIGAVRLTGAKWPWSHGSNYAARNRVNNLRRVSSAKELHLGELVFKAKEPGESGYDLPSTYRNDPDRRDYYHVGVVTSVSPFRITHCTSIVGGIQIDDKLGKWNYGGELNLVDYAKGNKEEKGETVAMEAKVYSENGKAVNFRANPGSTGRVIGRLNVGTVVNYLKEYDPVWSYIEYNGTKGYMMTQFLDLNGEQNGEVTITMDREMAMALLDLISAAL